MRIEGMITQEELSWYFNNFSPQILKEMYGDKKGDFAFWSWWLKGTGTFTVQT